MAAKVTLQGAASHTHGITGRSFRQGESQIIEDEAEVRYYRTQPQFGVSEIAPKKEPVAAPVAAKSAKTKAKAVVADDDDGEPPL